MSPEQDKFLDNLFRQYAHELWRYAISYLKDSSRAEEIVQDTFQTASMHVKDLMEHEFPEGWLKKTAKNKILKSEEMRRRYMHRFLSLDTEIAFEVATPEDAVEQQIPDGPSPGENLKRVLTEEELYLLRRITLEKATHKAVAQELGITVWGCQKRLQRIREKLYEVFPERKKKK